MRLHRLLLTVCLLNVPAWGSDSVVIPGGDFQPPVLLDREIQTTEVEAFLLDAAPVSKTAFAEFVTTHPEWRRSAAPRLFRDGGYLRNWTSDLDPGVEQEAQGTPVTHVSWYAARAFCHSRGGHLPSMTQWEYVVSLLREKNQVPDDEYARWVFGWYGAQRPVDFVDRALGIKGMLGLVNEWIEDYQLLLSNGEQIDFGGGSCGDTARLMVKYDNAHYASFLRYQSRSNYTPVTTTSNLGFRCAYPLEGAL
ncbi:formylglycine-generating enzyme family protein [Marinimicrobium sp. ABcell2]|uniref:formylglycine-generating enzyme family protein n=1 Tax=Marinimicrobium sp. ABcell2 TaxID=3069751 RepID=UPI0027B500A5|nr:formylglycine-generating enzyme family protein [Marinimicrobium sp. ABcell2]MDQ2076440.1 formylglycine-generating enzyme family protein [Marinimicrobium sp. ABcell2]